VYFTQSDGELAGDSAMVRIKYHMRPHKQSGGDSVISLFYP
jgi:hypothetical protein